MLFISLSLDGKLHDLNHELKMGQEKFDEKSPTITLDPIAFMIIAGDKFFKKNFYYF
jgi:hypothetical protein